MLTFHHSEQLLPIITSAILQKTGKRALYSFDERHLVGYMAKLVETARRVGGLT